MRSLSTRFKLIILIFIAVYINNLGWIVYLNMNQNDGSKSSAEKICYCTYLPHNITNNFNELSRQAQDCKLLFSHLADAFIQSNLQIIKSKL